MIIRNKFNGYGFDGARRYNDPATLLLMAKASTAAATTATVAAPTIAAATALPTVVAAGSTLPTTAAFTGQAVTPALTSAGGSGLAGTTAGSVAPGAFGSGITGGTTALPGMPGAQTLASASPEIASNLAAAGNTGIMSGAPGAVTAAPITAAPVTAAPAPPFSANPTGDPSIAKAISGNPTYTPDVASNAPFAHNPTGDPTIANAMSNPPPSFTDKAINAGKTVGDYFMDTMKFAEKHPLATSAVAQGIQYMMRPKPPKKKQYSGSDMSSFEASEPNAGIYTPVYQTSSNYAIGGQVEQMAAQNAVGANTGYPMANLQTPMYSNPMMQRPQATNVIAPSADAGVATYTGEPRFAQGGSTSNKYLKMMEEEEKKRREDAEDAEARTKKFDVGVVSRSRTQQLSNPYAAALQELQAAYKKRGIPFAKPAKTSTDVMGESLDEVPYAAGGEIMRGKEMKFSNGGPAFMGPSGAGSPQEKQGPAFMGTSGSPTKAEVVSSGGPAFMGQLPGGNAAPAPTAPRSYFTYSDPTQQTSPIYSPISYQDDSSYDMPAQQSGTDDFYNYMDQQLANYGTYGYAAGGGIMSHLGGYSDGGRLLKGPGDGMSDSIPAKIGAKQPARLADGEFVIPADVVSHLGNGSTEAGAKKLYAMMNKVRHARTGNKKQGKQINPDKFIPKA
jgi:hypothetical protein